MASIGSLVADLKLESAAFIRDLSKAQAATARSTSAMQKSMATMQRSFATVASNFKGMVAGFISVAGVRAFANLAKSSIDFADSIGDVSTALGISAEALQRYRAAGEQADVSIERMDTALKLFQKNLASGKSKDPSFEAFVQRIREAPDQITKVKIAQEGLSKQFQTGILLAKQSAEEFRQNYQSAATVSQTAADNADTLSKQWIKVQDVVSKGFAEGFLTGFTGDIKLSQESLDDFREAAEKIGSLSASVVTWLGTIGGGFASLVSQIDEAVTGLREYIVAQRDANLARMEGRGGELPPLRSATPDVPTFGASSGRAPGGLPQAQEAAKAALAEAEARKVAIAQIEYEKGAKERLAEATRLANTEQEKTKSLIESTRTPYEEYIATLEKVSATQIKTGEAAVAAGRMQQMAAAQAIQPWLGIADTLAGALGAMFKENKAVAIAQAIINTAQAIAATIAQYGFTPIGIAAAAAAAAMGAAQIATIRSSSPGGGGSSPRAASGGSGRAATEAAGPAGPQRSIFIKLEGSSNFTPDQMRNLIGQLIDAQKDGAKLILAKQ